MSSGSRYLRGVFGRRTATAFFLAAAVLFLFSGCSRRNETGVRAGAVAPPIELPVLGGLNGEIFGLTALRGKVVLVNFWASWCGPCISELPAMERLYNRLKSRGFAILAVGVDDEMESLAEFQRRYGLTFPIVVDVSGEVKARYKLNGVPESFIIDREGRMAIVPDPEDGIPAVRIVGPREWDSPNAVARLEALLQQQP
jgi:thiol-disulfide isomerase/thioredoxin